MPPIEDILVSDVENYVHYSSINTAFCSVRLWHQSIDVVKVIVRRSRLKPPMIVSLEQSLLKSCLHRLWHLHQDNLVVSELN